MLGMSFKLRVLVVCHFYRSDDKVIRIVSARKANKKEATELGMPYQNLINLYLRDCAINHRKLLLKWAS